MLRRQHLAPRYKALPSGGDLWSDLSVNKAATDGQADDILPYLCQTFWKRRHKEINKQKSHNDIILVRTFKANLVSERSEESHCCRARILKSQLYLLHKIDFLYFSLNVFTVTKNNRSLSLKKKPPKVRKSPDQVPAASPRRRT